MGVEALSDENNHAPSYLQVAMHIFELLTNPGTPWGKHI